MSKTQDKRNTSNRSDVWQYIACDKVAKVARCNICSKTMKYTGGTTNLRYHLTASHQMEQFEVVGPSARVYKEGGEWRTGKRRSTCMSSPTIRISGGTPRSASKSTSRSSPASCLTQKSSCTLDRLQSINSQVVMLLAQSLLPISMVEDEGFARFLNALELGYTMPSRTLVQSLLMTKYEEAQEKLKICLHKDAKNFGLMFDVWTGSNKATFMTVTIHYLTSMWTRESWVLGTNHVSTRPSCSELSMCIRTLLVQYQLSLESITAVVNRQGMLKGGQTKIGGTLLCDSMSCAAEKLEQCVQAALQVSKVKEAIEEIAKMVTYLLQNEEAREILDKVKAESKLDIDLEDNCKGSWLATAEMLIKTVALRQVIETVKEQDEKNLPLFLDVEKWDSAAQLVQSLQILKAALTVLGDPQSGSVSCLLPVVHSILQHCEGREEDGSVVTEFLNAIAKEVRDKWDLNAIMPASVTMLSALLDPRFKQLKFIAEEDKLDVVDALKQLVAANSSQGHDSNVDQPSNNVSPFLCLFGEDEFNSKPENSDAEVTSYMSYPPLSREMCPLDWWRMNQGKFPELAKIARCYLAVPAIAQSWEDIMSGTYRMDLKRGLLERDTAAPLIFLNKNWSILS